MNKLENTPFIDALEFGVEHLQEGVSYNEVIAQLKSKGWTNVENESFRIWFYESFDCLDYYLTMGSPQEGLSIIKIDKGGMPATRYDEVKSIINGKAYFKYLDFLEIRKAFENAESSKRTATTALIVTIIVGLAQSALTIWQILKG